MFYKIDYMGEIKRINNSLEKIDNNNKKELLVLLGELEKIADDMASYISGDWYCADIDFLKQRIAHSLSNNEINRYLEGIKDLLYVERIMLICSTQTPDEKKYFLDQYTRYKDNQMQQGISKVR